MDLPRDLREALTHAVSGVPVKDLAEAVDSLIDRYRSGRQANCPILSSRADVAAYAAYRMPATYAAVRAVLAHTSLAAPALAPRTHVDIGGGTGAAAWAAVAAFPGIATVAVIDQVREALDVGRRIAAGSTHPALRAATWMPAQIETAVLTGADLVTISYVLGELTAAVQIDLVRRAAATAGTVVIVEPGTPAGYERVIDARTALIESGLTVIAPCPHQGTCPIILGRDLSGRDWCHFAARVSRSSLHRRLKDADLGYEDEKFSYVSATRVSATSVSATSVSAMSGAAGIARGRVVRRPQLRKGLVTLQVCTPANGIAHELISKRQGDVYRAARDTSWGDTWPQPSAAED